MNNDISQHLAQLTKRQTSIFCLNAVSRIIHFYDAFANEISNETDAFFEVFKNGPKIIHSITESLINDLSTQASTFDIRHAISSIDSLIPDSDEISTIYSGLAQCSSIALYYTLIFYDTGVISNALHCSEKVFETIDIDPNNASKSEAEFDALFKREFEYQSQLAHKLYAINSEYFNIRSLI